MEKRIRRLADFDYVGPYRYFLTISTYQCAPLFVRDDVVECVRTHFLQAAADTGYAVILYTAMPDHLHLLADGRDAAVPLPAFMKRAKQLSGYYGKRIAHRRVWQPGYYDDIVGSADANEEYIRYIAMNPVRARLVADPREYPYTGSGVFSRDQLREKIRSWCDLPEAKVIEAPHLGPSE